VTPLADGIPANGPTPAEKPVATQLGFRQRKFLGEAATRRTLLQLLEGADATPSLLFTVSHGMVWPNGDARQFEAQGALLCQDWPGFGSVALSISSPAPMPDTARLHGLITFHFACFGGGTPARRSYVFERNQAPPPIARGRSSRLAAPRCSRIWRRSRVSDTSSAHGAPPSLASCQARRFASSSVPSLQVLAGKPVGIAVQEFNDLSATLSDVLSGLLGKAFLGIPIDDVALASTWMQRNDAGGFVLLGDPAVRLRVADLV
jgi:hypothetical protein